MNILTTQTNGHHGLTATAEDAIEISRQYTWAFEMRLDAKFATREEAEVAAATFPKAAKAKANICYGMTGNYFLVHAHINPARTGITGAANETGEKRIRQFFAAAAAL